MKKFPLIILISVASCLVSSPRAYAQRDLRVTITDEEHTPPINIDEKLEPEREPSLLEKYDSYLVPMNEILELRDRNSQHYRINDSTTVAILHSKPVYYPTSSGELVPISDTIIPAYEKSIDGWVYRNEANEVFFYFSENGSKCLVIGSGGEAILEIATNKELALEHIRAHGNLLSSLADDGSFSSLWSVNGYSVQYEFYDHQNVDNNTIPPPKIIWRQPATLLRESFNDQGEIRERLYDLNGLKILIANTTNNDSEQNQKDAISSSYASTTVTLYASAAKTIYRTSGGTYSDFSSELRFQNLSSSGCSYGYRFWVKYDLSSIPDIVEIQDVDQYIYVYDLEEGTFDFLNYDVRRVSDDPEASSLSTIWNDIYSGALYENDEWVSNPPAWEWSDLDDISTPTSADEDFENALISDWFALGYMVDCNENDSDYYALFRPISHSNKPKLLVQYQYDQPDLIIEDFTASPPVPNQGAPVSLCAEVKNQGTYNSSSTILRFKWNGPEIGTVLVPGLLPSGSITKCISHNFSDCVENGQIRVSVDEVPFELDTTNNSRVEAFTVACLPPTVSNFKINNGSTSTTSRTVTLNHSATNSPTLYMASESSSFSGASWNNYTSAPSFMLSSGYETKRVYFKVKNTGGESNAENDDIVLTDPSSGIENPNKVPNTYQLEPAYPNPFNPETTIRFELPKSTYIRLGIYDMSGREIFRLVDERLPAGYHHVVWNATSAATGIYLYRLKSDEFVQTRKMLLLK